VDVLVGANPRKQRRRNEMAVSVAAPITPSVLTWARQQAAVTVPELARTADVKPERVLQWEAGEAAPTVAKLRKIASMLKQPMALFFAPSPPATRIQTPPDFRDAGATIDRGLTREIMLAEARRDTFKLLAPELVAESRWPTWHRSSGMTPAEARTRLGVTRAAVKGARSISEALKLWITAVEDQGVLVFQMSGIGDGECSGFCMDDATTPIIVLNGKDAPQRRVFTLLHELGHLIDHSGGLCLLQEDNNRERACNQFAEGILMPDQAVRMVVDGLDGVAAVDAVERDFRVSRTSAAVALRRRGLVSRQVVDAEMRRSDEARKHATESDGFAPPARLKRRNLGDRYLGTVLDAMDAEAISVADATYYLGAKVGMIDKLERELAGSAS